MSCFGTANVEEYKTINQKRKTNFIAGYSWLQDLISYLVDRSNENLASGSRAENNIRAVTGIVGGTCI